MALRRALGLTPGRLRWLVAEPASSPWPALFAGGTRDAAGLPMPAIAVRSVGPCVSALRLTSRFLVCLSSGEVVGVRARRGAGARQASWR